jgi:hypothetical protein
MMLTRTDRRCFMDRLLAGGLILAVLAFMQFCCMWMNSVGAAPQSTLSIGDPVGLGGCCAKKTPSRAEEKEAGSCHSGSRSCNCDLSKLTILVSAQSWTPDPEVVFPAFGDPADASLPAARHEVSRLSLLSFVTHPPGPVPAAGPDASRAPPQTS